MGWLDKLLGRKKRGGSETMGSPSSPDEGRQQEGAGMGGQGEQPGSMGPEPGGTDRPEEDRI